MTIAQDIIQCRMPDFDFYLRQGESLDDIDEYGFTPLIEAAITRQLPITEALLKRRVNVNKADVTGRTALHWSVDNADFDMTRVLLEHGADPNAYTRAGLSVLVYPVLRGQDSLKHLLYQFGARLEFALDFIQAKLIGHRFELSGDTDILNAAGEFIELDYEGFILEFTVAVLKDSLRRFTSSFSTRHLRHYFAPVHDIIDAYTLAAELLSMQHLVKLRPEDQQRIAAISKAPLLILPAASRGHALGFVKCGEWWAKVDRGENSLKEGSVNLYRITNPKAFTADFIRDFLFKKQARDFFHQSINRILGLVHHLQFPMPSQIVGNCSWANIQALVPAAYALFELSQRAVFSDDAMHLYHEWIEWDKDRALDECIQRFYLASPARRASIASVLGAVLFQATDYTKVVDMKRAEKIIPILTQPDYAYILRSYLDIYCIKRLTRKGNNLLKVLDECGVNPNIGVNPIATGLKKRK